MEVNVCKNCESYRVDGCCYRTCESWNKAVKSVGNYCSCREWCDGCPLRDIGCGYPDELRNQVSSRWQKRCRPRTVRNGCPA